MDTKPYDAMTVPELRDLISALNSQREAINARVQEAYDALDKRITAEAQAIAAQWDDRDRSALADALWGAVHPTLMKGK